MYYAVGGLITKEEKKRPNCPFKEQEQYWVINMSYQPTNKPLPCPKCGEIIIKFVFPLEYNQYIFRCQKCGWSGKVSDEGKGWIYFEEYKRAKNGE